MSEDLNSGMEDSWLAERAEAAADPSSWQQTSFTLIYGAHVLWERHRAAAEMDPNSWTDKTFPTVLGDIHVSRAAFFLLATGTEAALKSIAVKKDPSLVFNNESQFSSGHNLVALAQNHCQLNPTSEEKELLKRLEHWIKWAGRYPAPRLDKRNNPPKVGFAIRDYSDLPESVNPRHWVEAFNFVSQLLNLRFDEPKE